MATTGTSLLEQTEKKKKGWSGLKDGITIQNAVNNFDKNLAEYNTEGTTDERKSELNAMYGGDITKFSSGDDVYKAYNDDMQYINKIDSLNAGYESTVKAAEQAEQKQLQYADTRRQLMEKYLPETLMAQGVANTGYTADALLKAENNYNQYVLGAMNEKAATEQNALQQYQQALGAYKAERAEKAYADMLAKQEEERLAEQEAKDYQSTLYNGAIDLLNEGYTVEQVRQFMAGNNADEATIAKFNDFYEAGGGNTPTANTSNQLTPETDYNYTSQSIQVSTTKSKDKFKLQGEDDVFRVNINGQDYKVKSGSKVSDAAVLQYAQDNVEAGGVFLFKNKIYVKDGSGNVYTVGQKGWASGAYKAVHEALVEGFKSQYNS